MKVSRFAQAIWHFFIPKYLRDCLYYYRRLFFYHYINWCKLHCKKIYADYLFQLQFGHKVNWKSPRDINEVIHVLEFTTDISMWSMLADKYLVRQYVAERGCEEILIKILGKWDNTNQIDFDNLPDSFVIKANNGCADVQIVQNKKEVDLEKIKQKLSKSINSVYGIESAEIHYSNIKPCIFAEELLKTHGHSLIDYKIWCFNGEPFCILTTFNRNIEKHIVDLNLFDLEWNCIDDRLADCYRNDNQIEKPLNLDKMINYAKILSVGFPQVRIDLYNIEGHVFFGEMTFTSQAGRMDYFTDSFLKEMGSKVHI